MAMQVCKIVKPSKALRMRMYINKLLKYVTEKQFVIIETRTQHQPGSLFYCSNTGKGERLV